MKQFIQLKIKSKSLGPGQQKQQVVHTMSTSGNITSLRGLLIFRQYHEFLNDLKRIHKQYRMRFHIGHITSSTRGGYLYATTKVKFVPSRLANFGKKDKTYFFLIVTT